MIPIIDLLAGLTILVAIALWPLVGARILTVALANLLIVVLLSSLRAARIVTRAGRLGPLTILQAFLVAFTYDIARAAALVTRA